MRQYLHQRPQFKHQHLQPGLLQGSHLLADPLEVEASEDVVAPAVAVDLGAHQEEDVVASEDVVDQWAVVEEDR